ncbi:hypothetical protein JTB14_021781 [Gonioctena quinquepunctata]|nr:hypothetical protein JTB14_021781 [Gonioctena quinquepunctata]
MNNSTCFLKYIIILVWITVNFENVTTDTEKCGPHYCDNKRFNCGIILVPPCPCNETSRVVPELCSCCPKCYKTLNEGEKCGNDPKSICADGLKCINNICTCAASYK